MLTELHISSVARRAFLSMMPESYTSCRLRMDSGPNTSVHFSTWKLENSWAIVRLVQSASPRKAWRRPVCTGSIAGRSIDLLHPRHASLYRPEGLGQLAEHLHPGGVFALWSNDPPDDAFECVLAGAFAISAAHVVTFDNPLQQRDASNTVYIGSKPTCIARRQFPGSRLPPIESLRDGSLVAATCPCLPGMQC